MEGGKGVATALLIWFSALLFILLLGFIMTFIFRRKRKKWAFIIAASCVLVLLFFYFSLRAFQRGDVQFCFIAAFLMLFLLVQPVLKNDPDKLWLRFFFEGFCLTFIFKGLGILFGNTEMLFLLLTYVLPMYILFWINPVTIYVLVRYVKHYPERNSIRKWPLLYRDSCLLGLALVAAQLVMMKVEDIMAGIFAGNNAYVTHAWRWQFILYLILITIAYSIITTTIARWIGKPREAN